MREEYVEQFDHLWRTFLAVVGAFDEESWIAVGSGITTPARTAYHIIRSTKQYTEDPTPIVYGSNRSVSLPRAELSGDELPSKYDIPFMVEGLASRTRAWLREIDLEARNTTFPWTGKTNLSVVLFLLRHSQYHLGEINALLNDSLSGNAADYFANTVATGR